MEAPAAGQLGYGASSSACANCTANGSHQITTLASDESSVPVGSS